MIRKYKEDAKFILQKTEWTYLKKDQILNFHFYFFYLIS